MIKKNIQRNFSKSLRTNVSNFESLERNNEEATEYNLYGKSRKGSLANKLKTNAFM